MFSRILHSWHRKRLACKSKAAPLPCSADTFHQRLAAIGNVILRHRWTPLIIVVATLFIHFILREVMFPAHDPLEVAARACAAQGEWFDVDTADTIDQSALINSVSDRSMVLLGKTETHDPEEGRWLGFTVAALYGIHRHIVIAIDAFAPSQQVVLDRWVRGKISSEAELIEALDWRYAYTPDPQTYIPLFRLARLYHLPLLAVGIDEETEKHFALEDWEAIPTIRRRAGVPVETPEGYRRSLAALHLAEELARKHHSATEQPPRLVFREELTPILVSVDFQRFLLARRGEDWLIAHQLMAGRRRASRPLVVGVIGRSHLEYGWGVPTQLASLGIDNVAVLLPFAGGGDCALVRPGVADAVFILEPGPIASASAAVSLPGRAVRSSGEVIVSPTQRR